MTHRFARPAAAQDRAWADAALPWLAGLVAYAVVAFAPQVLEKGGLHVILCQLNASPRIDRQFAGRAGRQGQPGSVHRMAALDFPLLQRWWPAGWLRWLARRCVPAVVTSATVTCAQARQSFTERNERVKLCRVVAAEERDLTFSRQVHYANR